MTDNGRQGAAEKTGSIMDKHRREKKAAVDGLMDKQNKTLDRIYHKGKGRGELPLLDFSISVIH